MDLFASGQSSGVIGAPAWPELPAEVQGTLTNLMAQLILEHADKSKTAVTTESSAQATRSNIQAGISSHRVASEPLSVQRKTTSSDLAIAWWTNTG
ncbi:hypothetical protein [Bradyrhizobium iriomotense]|nr:hypothetical protein [Bradyrhizobium iriomotense]